MQGKAGNRFRVVAAKSMSPEQAVRARTLMVIDDDEISLSLISLLLRSEGYEVIPASSGEAALDLLACFSPESRPSVVVTDLHMPGLSGGALAGELHRSAPKAKLLAMSATPDPADGYDGFLKKPLDPAALRTFLGGHSISAEAPETSQAAHDYLPVLDENVFQKMSRMMPSPALREVYEACLSDTRAREQQMRAAIAANDFAQVSTIAHSIKGSAGMVGAKKLAATAADLELGAYEPGNVSAMIDKLLSNCDELHRILLAKLP
jgi:CheY-like chemotaxis protein